MLGRRPVKKRAQAKGQGAAAAKQLGLFADFSPEEMMLGMTDDCDDGDLEAELAALTGEKPALKTKPKGKAPLPMDHIEKMAQDCMRDSDQEDDEDEDLEDDDDLLAELQEVVGGEEEEADEQLPSDCQEEAERSNPDQHSPAESVQPLLSAAAEQQHTAQVGAGELLKIIEERIGNYKIAISNATQAKESAKARRYERGLKTLESMLRAVKQGKAVNEEEIPPPVSSGNPAANSQAPVPAQTTQEEGPGDQSHVPTATIASAVSCSTSEDAEDVTKVSEGGANTSGEGATSNEDGATGSRILLLTRQREYKMAALRAKQSGDVDQAKEYMKISKKFSAVIEALESGQPVDLSNMPPAPDGPDVEVAGPKTPMQAALSPATEPSTANTPGAASSVLPALQQRMERYRAAAQQAKGSGDDRKARMHERIVKQYQDAIRAQKAGRQVNLAELPVPPGFPPLPGVEHTEGEGSVERALEAAETLANAEEGEDEREDERPAKPPIQIVKPLVVLSETSLNQAKKPKPAVTPAPAASGEQLPPAAMEQLEFLENRRDQCRKAALQAKQKNDLEQAKLHMRAAHSLQANIDLVKSGGHVDISKLPSPLTDDDNGFVVIEHEDARPPQNSEDVYTQLLKLLQEQHEKCLRYSKQFTQMGNVAETTRFEKMAQDCKKNCEILHLSQAQGLDPPPYHFEDKTLKIVRIFSELSSTEMLLIIVRGVNLPAPSGVAPNDLDAFVKFEFPYPSTEQAQKNKTSVIKNTNSPEYEQHFKLNINRNHRGFKRVVQAKGIKFEIFHKGVFLLRSDKQVGSANVKLDKLETQCEIREIVEVFDGRKATGGKLEVKVRLREPLSGQDLQTVSEKWLVMGQVPHKTQ